MKPEWDRVRAVINVMPSSWASGMRAMLDVLQRGERLSAPQLDALSAVIRSDLHESMPGVWEIAWTLDVLAKHGPAAFEWMSVDSALRRAEANR